MKCRYFNIFHKSSVPSPETKTQLLEMKLFRTMRRQGTHWTKKSHGFMNCHVPSVPSVPSMRLCGLPFSLWSYESYQWSCRKQCLSCLSFWPKAPELNAPANLHVLTSSNGKGCHINPDRHSLDLALLAPFSIKLTRVNDAMASKAAKKVGECSWLKRSSQKTCSMMIKTTTLLSEKLP